MNTQVIALALAFMTGGLLTLLARRTARRFHLAKEPAGDRWSSRPVSTLGGIAIAAAIGTTILVLHPDDGSSAPGLVLLLGALFMFAVGLVDDHRPLDPKLKLLLQIVAAFVIAFSGHNLGVFPTAVAVALSTIWIVLIMNAINLIDNMDGVSGSTVAAAAIGLATISWSTSGIGVVTLLAIAGAALGFLTSNWPRARIYMGDAGSLLLGTLLGSLSLDIGKSLSTTAAVSVAVLACLAVPVFDTVFVVVNRIRRGDSPWQGGQDHTSHLLVRRGMSNEMVIAAFVGITFLASLGGYVAATLGMASALPIFLALTMILSTAFFVLSPDALTAGLRSGSLVPGIGE